MVQVAPPQVKGAHVVVAPALHWPVPLQVDAAVAVPPSHDAPAHSIDAPGKAQAVRLMPSHAPAQAPVPPHAAREPPGAPVTAVHCPSRPATLHAAHCPSHASPQHTPSTHGRPPRQPVDVVHDIPSPGCARQVPALHRAPLAHCRSSVQVVRHAPDAQVKRPQSSGAPAGHSALEPEQFIAARACPPTHDAARHDTVEGWNWKVQPCCASQAMATSHASAARQVVAAPVHAPLTHTSLLVHTLLSVHAVPSAFDGFEHTPRAGLQVPAAWHWSSAAQVTGFAPVHEPAWQASVCEQALPSLQAVPSACDGFVHTPVAGLHVPEAWHWSSAVQVTVFPLAHVPAWQVSVCVQALLSLQVVPLGFNGFEHAPVAGLQVPEAWHWSSAVQVTGIALVQVPAWQVSVCVQALPSLQAVPVMAAQVPLDAAPRATLQA